MTEIVNLNQFRKYKRRADDRKTAENNRVKFGMTKVERAAAKAESAAREKDLDGKKANPGGED